MELKDLQDLAKRIAASFAVDQEQRENAKAASAEMWSLTFAQIKRDGAKMTDGDHVNLIVSFGVQGQQMGWAKSTIGVRKADLRCVLENYKLIPDGAKAFRPTVDGIRLELKPVLQRLTEEVEKATKAELAAIQRRVDAERDLAEYQAGIESGIIEA
jgi:hypothetical protein